ncbi:glycoside hydrolase family 6 protein [Pseudomonas gingeri]|uniref:Glucanase n=1 Tax=Pseudomonas gingeri TaxID=117681 RepID=A0A7Y8C263_9PSED|nr:glycoside hydrolase family 6 protein [Pseudomonas gingeri]NWA24615.1 glycoside hydrolase family 6 protein [Pseudomonas gingeri]NWB96768.1 glycoside hydrolase family 6 protein [Pseudomonas gingeri]
MPKAVLLTACFISLALPLAAYANDSFYVNPGSSVAQWVKANPDTPRSAKIQAAIASVPSAHWLTGTSQTTDKLTNAVSQYVEAANKADKTPILVAYNLPGRDCSGGASAGGAANAVEYRDWIDRFINGIGDKPAVIILEPDALADSECLTQPKRDERLALFNYAVSGFKQRAPSAAVYLDAGNAGWKPSGTMAGYLNAAGMKDARGFALNVSNFYTLDQSRTYGDAINARLSADYGYAKSMVIDTSRNGNGAIPGDWCNPSGRKIGLQPQAITETVLAAWIKIPGNSDGSSSATRNCHGGPTAGTFSPDLAEHLIDGN